MTVKLFYSEPNTYEWSTAITSVIEHDNQIVVTLSETAFYPTGGGQPHDIGFIDSIKVIEVFEEDDEIYHVIKAKPKNTLVNCKIDDKRRIDHTQHHTGQHLLSAVCIDLFDAQTVSFHLGENTVTIDLDIAELSDEQLKAIEERTNQYIYENRQVKTYIVTKDELSNIPLRKLPNVPGEIRIVEIEGLDYSACCGTHVQQTAEIGLMKLLKTEKHRGKTRLQFICGFRAIRDYQEKHDIITRLSKNLSTVKEDILDRFKKLEADKKEVQRKLEEILNENAQFVADTLLSRHQAPIIIEWFPDKSFQELQVVTKHLILQTERLMILASLQDKKCLIQHNGKMNFHCGQFVKEYNSSFHGKGGGDKNKAQVTFINENDLHSFLDHCKTSIKIKEAGP